MTRISEPVSWGSNIDVGDVVELSEELRQAVKEYEGAVEMLRDIGQQWAESEHAYERAHGAAIVLYVDQGASVAAAERRAEAETNRLRLVRDKATAAREYAKALVREREVAVSALQTRASLLRSQAAFDRTGPD
jgi:hypothetical protein